MKKTFRHLILLFCLFVACFLLWQQIYLSKEPGSTETKIFSIASGQGSKEIALNLEKEGLIKWDLLFRLYVSTKGVSGRLQAGTYGLNPSMTIPQIAEKFASGDTLKIKVTIPEGFTIKDIEDVLALSFPRSVLGNFQVKDFKGEFDFLADSPDASSLEGFLFPDTYFFEINESDKEIVNKFLVNFQDKFVTWQEKASAGNRKIFEIITMASLLEKEVNTIDDKRVVSGILWKRLENKIPLQVDATIVYITGKNTTRISIEETKIDSPYNTYKYLGLPAGPISNPGLESILAALTPQKSEFWYYLSTPEGETVFNETLEDHNIDRAKLLR